MPEANNRDEVLLVRADVNRKEQALLTKWNKLSSDVQEKARKEFDLEDALRSADKPEAGDYSDVALQQLKDLLESYAGYDERLTEVLAEIA